MGHTSEEVTGVNTGNHLQLSLNFWFLGLGASQCQDILLCTWMACYPFWFQDDKYPRFTIYFKITHIDLWCACQTYQVPQVLLLQTKTYLHTSLTFSMVLTHPYSCIVYLSQIRIIFIFLMDFPPPFLRDAVLLPASWVAFKGNTYVLIWIKCVFHKIIITLLTGNMYGLPKRLSNIIFLCITATPITILFNVLFWIFYHCFVDIQNPTK